VNEVQGQRGSRVLAQGGKTFLSTERLCRQKSLRGDRPEERLELSIDRCSQKDGKGRTPAN